MNLTSLANAKATADHPESQAKAEPADVEDQQTKTKKTKRSTSILDRMLTSYDSEDDYDSKDKPANHTELYVGIWAGCYLCGTKFKPSKDARPKCQLRLAKSNLGKHALTKGDDKHKALA